MFDKRVLLPCILVAFNYMAIAGTVNFMGAFGKEINVGGSISQFFIAQGIAMVLVRAFSGKIFDRFGHRILIIPAAISGAVGLILLGFSTSMWMVLVSGVLFGIAFAIHPSNYPSLGINSCSTREKSNSQFYASYFYRFWFGHWISRTWILSKKCWVRHDF